MSTRECSSQVLLMSIPHDYDHEQCILFKMMGHKWFFLSPHMPEKRDKLHDVTVNLHFINVLLYNMAN